VLGRDRGLIATVALALMVLPGAIGEVVVPASTSGSSPDLGWSSVTLLILLVTILGQLTIARIALGRRQSVGEAMAHGVRRSPSFLLATILWLLPFVLLAAPFAVQVQANPQAPPPGALLPLFAITLVFLFVAVRMIFSTAVSVAENVGPLAILRRSWALTAGSWWRLFGFLVLFMITAVIALGAVTAVVGVVVGLISGEPERLSVGSLVNALVGQTVAAIITVLLTVMLTRLYLQVAEPADEPVSVPHAP
jgi:hypothetical protein